MRSRTRPAPMKAPRRAGALLAALALLSGAAAQRHPSHRREQEARRNGRDAGAEGTQRADRRQLAGAGHIEGRPDAPQCRAAESLALRRSMQQELTQHNVTPFLLAPQEPVACIECQNPIVDWWQALCRGDTQAPWEEVTTSLCPPERQKALRHHFVSRSHLYDELLLWQPCDLWRHIRGKTLWIGGDSHSQGFYQTLRCVLHQFHDYDWVGPHHQDLLDVPVHWVEPRSPHRAVGPGDAPSLASCEPLVEGTRLCQFRANWGKTMVDHAVPWLAKLAKPGDILVANFGAWHGTQAGGPQEYPELVRRLADAMAAQLPGVQLVWKDTSPTHFDTYLGGFEAAQAPPFTCVPLKASVQHDGSLRAYSEEERLLERGGFLNAAAAEALQGTGVPIMGTFNATAELWEAHKGEAGTSLECNHFCLPGVPAVWVFYLYKALEAVAPLSAQQPQ